MKKKTVKIVNKSGLHARPASEFVKRASSFTSGILIKFDEKTVNAKSIVGILSAGIKYNSEVEILVEGEDEDIALMTLVELIDNGFGE